MALTSASTFEDARAQFRDSLRYSADATGAMALDFAEACYFMADVAGKAMNSEAGGKSQADYLMMAQKAEDFYQAVGGSASSPFTRSGPV